MSATQQPGAPGPHEVERWLSRARLDRYVSRCSGDLELALELYIWNSRIAAAAVTDTCHLEVALRNAYESELSTRFPDWTIDPKLPDVTGDGTWTNS